jgi:hypothetical protein
MTGTNGVEVQNGVEVERTEREIELLKQMREKIAVLDPLSKDIDDATLMRFLRARAMDVTKSAKLFADHQKWRRDYFPHGHVQASDIPNEIAAKKFFIQGYDRQGRPLSLFVGNKHFITKSIEDFKKCVTLFVDKLVASLPPGQEKFSIIADLKGVKFKNLDVRGWLAAYDCLQAYYPERLGRVYVLNAPTIFWGAWKVIVPFLDPVTRAKIMFVDAAEVEATLTKDINKEELPIQYGGTKELVPLEAVQPLNWPMYKPAT